jgi:hypothetical protein
LHIGDSKEILVKAITLLAIVAALIFVAAQHPSTAVAAPPAAAESALKAADITNKIFPDQVFFRGQVAPVQMRNTGGLRSANDFFVLAGLVDNSGYSTDIRQKYQAYFITEVPLQVGDQKLAPGAYGVGFIPGNKFVVMDIGAHDLFQTDSARDSEMKRPVPLQVVPSGGKYRLYVGRDYVEIASAQ